MPLNKTFKLLIVALALISFVQSRTVSEKSSKITNIPFNNPKIPSPLGPYLIGKRIDPSAAFLYISGQIGLNPDTKTLPKTVEEQARQAMINIQTILHDANSSLDNILKATIYLTDMTNFAIVNTEYGKFFETDNYPTRACVAVKSLPMDALVEIDIVAIDNT